MKSEKLWVLLLLLGLLAAFPGCKPKAEAIPAEGVELESASSSGNARMEDSAPIERTVPVAKKAEPSAANWIMIMGRTGKMVKLYDSLWVDDEVELQLGKVIARKPPGTRGHALEAPVYAVLEEWGVKVELDDGTTGYLEVGSYGRPYRVANVRSDDTLNIRGGQTHKARKLGEAQPDSLLFVDDNSAPEIGCEDHPKGSQGRWWRVRSPGGVEGYVNCRYLGSY